ncbi:ComEC family competence protein [Patescibacteria group bacterium]|nr:MAG: ComEC family competence protein [Patescibacteria group bacterium]
MPIRQSLVIRLILAALILGIGLGDFLENDFAYWAVIGIGIAALIFSVMERNRIFYLTGILLLVFCFGGIWARLNEPIIDQSHIGFYNGQKILLQGIVVGEPEMKKASIRYAIREITADNHDLRGRLLITSRFYPEYHYGDLLEIECKLKKPEPFEGFEYDKYLSRYGIYSTCSFPKIALLEQNKGSAVRAMLLDFKKYFTSRLEKIFPAAPAALAAGLLTGERSGIPEELKDKFSTTGLSHILAVSGFNITIIGWAIYWVSARAPFMNRKRAFWLSLGIIFCFVLIAGFEASIIRAAIMGSLVLIAEQAGRRRSGLNLLLIAAAVMLLINPKLFWLDIGFQLSFLATFGLLEVSPRIEKYFLWMPETLELRKTFAATISAQIMTLPIIASSFGIVSLIAPLTNIIVLPLIPYIMLFVLIAGIGAVIFIKLGIALALVPLILIWYVIFIAQFFSDIPFAALEIESYWIVWIGFAISMILIFKKELKKSFALAPRFRFLKKVQADRN